MDGLEFLVSIDAGLVEVVQLALAPGGLVRLQQC